MYFTDFSNFCTQQENKKSEALATCFAWKFLKVLRSKQYFKVFSKTFCLRAFKSYRLKTCDFSRVRQSIFFKLFTKVYMYDYCYHINPVFIFLELKYRLDCVLQWMGFTIGIPGSCKRLLKNSYLWLKIDKMSLSKTL